MKVLELTAEAAVPLADEVKNVDLRERIGAQAATLDLLQEAGLDIEVTQEDIDAANALASSFASDPEKTSIAASHFNSSKLPPGAVLLAKHILDEFGHAIVDSSTKIRNTIINKLVIETENPDPRIRIRALELLGKMSDVALFTERSEVTVTHQSSNELKGKLKQRLLRLKEQEQATNTKKAEDGTYEPVLDPDADLEELGLGD